MITAIVEFAAAISVGTVAGYLAAQRGTQAAGRHRDHGHVGATAAYAAQLHNWNQGGRRG